MTHASDESPLDWRGPDISRRYRQLPVDSVPADLDRSILEHARAAVGAPAAARRTWIRWGVPLGLVGSALLAATLALDGARRQPQVRSIAQSQAEMPERAEAPVSATAQPPAVAASPVSGAQAPTAQSRPAAPAIASRRDENPVASLPISAPMPVSTPRRPPAAALVADAVPEPAIAATPVSEPPSPAPPPSVAPAQALEQSASSATTQAPAQAESQSAFEEFDALRLSTSSPAKLAAAEERLEDIRYMRQTGRNRRADYEWRKFLEDFPNYPVAADDIARPRAQ